jgi:hypothetical protein
VATKQAKSFPHADDSMAIWCRTSETHPIVLNADQNLLRPPVDRHPDNGGPGVTAHVGEALLDHPVDREPNIGRNGFRISDPLEVDGESCFFDSSNQLIDVPDSRRGFSGRLTVSIRVTKHSQRGAKLSQCILSGIAHCVQGCARLVRIGFEVVSRHSSLDIDYRDRVGQNVVHLARYPHTFFAGAAQGLFSSMPFCISGTLLVGGGAGDSIPAHFPHQKPGGEPATEP